MFLRPTWPELATDLYMKMSGLQLWYYVKLLDVGQESEFDQASLRTHISSVKAKIVVSDWFEAGRRHVASWNLAYHLARWQQDSTR